MGQRGRAELFRRQQMCRQSRSTSSGEENGYGSSPTAVEGEANRKEPRARDADRGKGKEEGHTDRLGRVEGPTAASGAGKQRNRTTGAVVPRAS